MWNAESAFGAASNYLADIAHGTQLELLRLCHDVINLLIEADAVGDIDKR